MWKLLWSISLLALAVGENVQNVATDTQKVEKANVTLPNIESPPKIDNKKEIPAVVEITRDETADEGSKANPFEPEELETVSDEDSLGNFKYYFVVLTLSSLSVLSIIVFRALRLRKSRAEIKYGKASTTDRSEVQPLGKSQWLEESSDENEDEIFDINFLKNSRTQKV